MRILVLGAAGMMGHMACRVLSEDHDVIGTIRSPWSDNLPLARFLPRQRCIDEVDVLDVANLERVIRGVSPDAVVNCVGIVKQLTAAKDAVLSVKCNSLLPHQLAVTCSEFDARLVHLSTDCVFSGDRGRYTTSDNPDPVDLYGRSKLLGETAAEEGLTIRTSIVGRQLTGNTSFFEWILASRGQHVRGFDRAIYSGLTTMALARVIAAILERHPELSGVWQVASEPVTKYELVVALNQQLDLDMVIERDTSMACDRSLDGSEFEQRTGIVVPTWDSMIAEFVSDQSTYATIEGPR